MKRAMISASLLGLFVVGAGTLFATAALAESSDAARNAGAAKDCVRGKFKDYYLQGQGGDPPVDYKGRVFKLSQDYPSTLPPMEDYPWLKIAFKDGGPVDPEAYLRALLAYGLEGNVDVDFYVQDNKVRKWYGMPWMDWNTEVASDWPGTDGREFVHGFTHEFELVRRHAQRDAGHLRRHLVGRLFQRPRRLRHRPSLLQSGRSEAGHGQRRPGRSR